MWTSWVKAQTTIEDFNAEFGTRFSDEDCDTVSGLVLNALGRVPRRKEEFDIENLHFQVLRADRRRLYTLLVTRRPPEPDALD
ncbi:MAG: transporter associated domain-containing protein [Propionivibrio sp.]